MSMASYVVPILGLAALMVVHEGGHYLAARYFGMRVLKFSIGFGPTLYRHQRPGNPTVFQIALIPFLAYVQIAGMNPYEETDPKDPESYANASLWGRIVTIAAGPLANYLFASVLFFAGFLWGGRASIDETSMRVTVMPGGPAQLADIRNGDRILSINGERVADWDQLKKAIGTHAGEPIDVAVERGSQNVHMAVTPGSKGEKYEGKILVGPEFKIVAVGAGEAAKLALVEPFEVVVANLRGLGRLITRQEKAGISNLRGPLGIVDEIAGEAKDGASHLLVLGALSACLAIFNLLPIPALDGGRLLFLAFEATARRKPDPKIEARIHALGLLMMLALIAVVTWSDIVRLIHRH